VQSTEDCDEQRRIWEKRFILKLQEDGAELVARSDGSRCSGPSAIARRSFVWRPRDSVVVENDILVRKK
jgi:hypothetical protein